MSNIQIYNEDCIVGMQRIESESIDCLVTDPPYRIIGGGNSTGKLKNASELLLKGKIFKYNDIKFSEWLPEVYRVLKPNTHAYIMINPRNLKELWEEAEKVGFQYQQLLVWNKGVHSPNKFYLNAYELILMLRKGKQRWINNMGCNNIITLPIVKNKKHPTQKPVPLMRLLVENSTNAGELVLDPFMGCGSTAIACQESNRNFIGFEIDAEYYQIAMNSIGFQQESPMYVNDMQIKFDLTGG